MMKKERNALENVDFIKRKDSKEVYLLKNCRWVLLKNDEHIIRSPFTRRINQLGGYYSTKEIEDSFMELNPDFPIIKELKEKYIEFNNSYFGRPNKAAQALNKLINEYACSSYSMFKEFSQLLDKRKTEIIASFNLPVTSSDQNEIEEKYRRMSNGPMEGFNRKPKDMKRLARGFNNFDYVRNRILRAERKDAHILGSPIPVKDIKEKYKTKKKRGSYKKHK